MEPAKESGEIDDLRKQMKDMQGKLKRMSKEGSAGGNRRKPIADGGAGLALQRVRSISIPSTRHRPA